MTDCRLPIADCRCAGSYNDDVRVFAQWRALDRRSKRLTLEAACFTALAVIRLKLGGMPRLPRSTAPRDDASAHADELRALNNATGRAARYVPGATCLPRALALTWMLKRRGIAATVRLGVRTDAGALMAHAWVECQGITLNGPADGDPFVALR